MYVGLFILVVVVLYAVWWRLLAKYRPQYVRELSEGRRCTWCHKAIGDDEESLERDPEMDIFDSGRFSSRSHLRCEQEAVKRHLRYYRLFLVMAVLVTVIHVGVAISGVREGRWTASDSEMLTPVLFAILLVFTARRMIVPWARRVERATRAAEGTDS